MQKTSFYFLDVLTKNARGEKWTSVNRLDTWNWENHAVSWYMRSY